MVCSLGTSLMMFRNPCLSQSMCSKGLVPKVHDAIKIVEEQGLCQREDLDLSKCRESLLLPGKVLLLNKKGWKVGVDSDLVACVVAIFKQERDRINF